VAMPSSLVPSMRPRLSEATTTVTPRIREQVFARDHHRCNRPGPPRLRNLEVHHIIEQGPRWACTSCWNLTFLCSGHYAGRFAGAT